MNERTQDRLFAACGDRLGRAHARRRRHRRRPAGASSRPSSSTPRADRPRASPHPAGTAVWVGAYLELLSFGCFLAFAIWACTQARRRPPRRDRRRGRHRLRHAQHRLARLVDAIEYRAGHGIGLQLATHADHRQRGLYVGTWFLSAFFLLAAAPLALASGRRALGWSAIAIAADHARHHRRLPRQPRPAREPALARLDRLRQHRSRPWRADTRCHRRRSRSEPEPGGST